MLGFSFIYMEVDIICQTFKIFFISSSLVFNSISWHEIHFTKNISFFQVREIEHEAYIKPKSVEQKEAKQAAAVDLISRLSNYRSYSDSGNLKGNYPITLSHSSFKGF